MHAFAASLPRVGPPDPLSSPPYKRRSVNYSNYSDCWRYRSHRSFLYVVHHHIFVKYMYGNAIDANRNVARTHFHWTKLFSFFISLALWMIQLRISVNWIFQKKKK